MRCVWKITGPQNKSIQFNFFDLQTEYCNDYIAIYDGNPTNDSLIGKFCGSPLAGTTTPATSTSNFMTVKFFTDGSLNYRGFKAVYAAVERSKLLRFFQ
jgi:hypothetical protein